MATTLYLHPTVASGIGSYRDMTDVIGVASSGGVVDTVASGTEIQWTVTAGGAVLEWISGRVPAGGFTLAGTMTFNLWALESNMNANCGARVRVYRYTGSLAEVGGGPYSHGTEFTTGKVEYTWTGAPTSTGFNEDDRLVVRYFITNVGTMAGGHTCTMSYDAIDSVGDSFFRITETVAFKPEPVTAVGPLIGGRLIGGAKLIGGRLIALAA